MDRRGRLGTLGLALAFAFTGCGESGDEEPETGTSASAPSTVTEPPATAPTTTAPASPTSAPAAPAIEVSLAGGQVVGGPRKETVKRGERVRIRATSDVPEVLHVHTYDLKTDLQPGVPGEIVFEATIPGRHEVEFENSGKDALTLEVR